MTKQISLLSLLLVCGLANAAITYVPGPWRLYRSGVLQSGSYTSAAECDAALRALPVNVGQQLTLRCQQSTVASGVADPPPPPTDDNPDNITETSSVLFSRDYNTQVASHVLSDPRIVTMVYGANSGNNSGGWCAKPQPITGSQSWEDSAGWLIPGSTFSGQQHLVVVSFDLKMSRALLDAIAANGSYWSHVNKVFDFKYKTASGGEGNRNGIHFGESPPRWVLSSGGAGQYWPGIGPDWRQFADQWVPLRFVVDMRAPNASGRYIAAYYREGSNWVRMGRRYESDATGGFALQSYNGNGFYGLFSPLFGYYDDQNGRENIPNVAALEICLDNALVSPGWPS